MADNVTTAAGSNSLPASTTIATDQLGTGEHVQFVKLMDGTLDGNSKVKATTNGLAVDINSVGVPSVAIQGVVSASVQDAGNASTVTFTASGAFTTNQTFVQANQYGRGIYVFHRITVIGAGTTLTVGVDIQDPASLQWVSLASFPGVTATGTYCYCLHPLAPASSAGITATSTFELPKTYRVAVATSNANSSTWSLGGQVIL